MEIKRLEVMGPDQGSYGLAYADWGPSDAARTVVCVHGLTRNGRDFDHLAEELSRDSRVLCPDIVGRGLSDRLPNPEHYAIPTYVSHMLQFLTALGLARVDWVGTSMGGLIGMGVAAHESKPIRRMVLNDVGPFIPREALARINRYLGQGARFDRLQGLEAHLREIHAGFGPLSDAEWRHLAEHGAARREDGRFGLNYDQRIAEPFRNGLDQDIDLWPVYEAGQAEKVLVLRGLESGLLLAETAEEMTRRGPPAEVVGIDATGHAPALMAADQIEIVRDWLGR